MTSARGKPAPNPEPAVSSTVAPDPAEGSMRRGITIRDLTRPEAVQQYELGETQQVRLAGTVISRIVLQRGWSWQEHARSQAGTSSCELYHRGVVLEGRFGVRMDDGEEAVIEREQVFDIRPGHVTWVDGDEDVVMLDWAGGAGFGVAPGTGLRSIATVLFTDVVDSTGLAQRRGDVAWQQTVDMHDAVVRSVLAGFGGREMNTAGDSFLVLFDSPERAIRCGLALVVALAAIGVAIRVGAHSGDVVLANEQVRGVAVHVAARIVATAAPGEVLVSGITRELADGTRGLAFESRGRHRLKGVEREHELFVATGA
jgi:class 3 adenylate cyclase